MMRNLPSKNGIYVTGYGVVSPYGFGVDKFREGLKEGKNAIIRVSDINVERLDTNFRPNKIIGVVNDPLVDYLKSLVKTISIDPRAARRDPMQGLDPYIVYSVLAGCESMLSAGILSERGKLTVSGDSFGVFGGTTAGGMPTLEDVVSRSAVKVAGYHSLVKSGASQAELEKAEAGIVTFPTYVSNGLHNYVSGTIAGLLGISGFNTTNVDACSTGNLTTISAMHAIDSRFSPFKKALVVSGESSHTRNTTSSFSKAGALSRSDNPIDSSPFGLHSDESGFVLSEGAGSLFLHQGSKLGNIKPKAQIIGVSGGLDIYGSRSVQDKHGTSLQMRIRQALHMAHLNPWDIDYIIAHGTGTSQGDLIEARAIDQVFQSHKPAIASIKGGLGHALAVSTHWSQVAATLAIEYDEIYPTVNTEIIDPNLPDLDFVLGKTRTGRKVNKVMVIGLGFGKQDNVLIFSKPTMHKQPEMHL